MSTRGFSLLELLVYIAIISLMSVVLAAAFTALTRGRAQSLARSDVESNARFALERITYDLTRAASVAVPTLAATSSTLEMTSTSGTINYAVTGGALTRSVNGGAGERITARTVTLDAPIFVRTENYNAPLAATTTAVQVVLTVRSANPGAEASYANTVRATIDLR